MQISISDIRLDGNTQARAGMKTETISDYAEAMKQGDQFPPVVVFNDGSNYWLADGFHRVYAARDIGLEEIDAEVREGSIHDARWFAVGANNRHGARPTNEDKRSAVQLALEDEKLSQLSDREIARQCHVSNGFVSRLRRDSSVYGTQSAELPTQETPRQNWAETIQEVIQQEQEKAERRLAEERAGMEETIRERIASVEQHYRERMSQAIAERVRMENDAAEQRLAQQREEYEAKFREAEARQQASQEPQPPQVEVREVVPPEVEEKLRAMASELEEIAEERETLQRKLASLQKAGKDLNGIQKQIADCHKSYERLKAKYDADDMRMQEGVALSNAVMEVQDFLEERKGRFERLARDGVLPWMSAPKVADVGSLCIEIGEMLIASTQVVSVGNPDKEGVVYIDGRDGQPVELQRRDERDESAGAGGDAGENLCPPDRGQAELQGCV